MKIKKLLVVMSMLAVMFGLAGCSNKEEKPFEYNEAEVIALTQGHFNNYKDISGEYGKYYAEVGDDFAASAINGIKQTKENDNIGEFGQFTDESSVEVVEGELVATVVNRATNRDVEITVRYSENPEYRIQFDLVSREIQSFIPELEANGYSMSDLLAANNVATIQELVDLELANQGITKYTPNEMTVSTIYSKSELMKSAAMNTLIGMGTVFCVLEFISFIISLFKFLPALVAKKPIINDKAKETKAPAPATVAPVAVAPVAVAAQGTDDSNLLAVITAAIYAMQGDTTNFATSKDTLVVRSIKRR